MIGSAPSDLPFRDRLRAVHDLSIRLSEASSFDELCRLAVKEGVVALGVDRMGLWFRIGETMEVEGSFGVDEAGQLRDERGARVTCAPGSQMWRVLSYASPAVLAKDAALLDHHADPVGKGDAALGALWDGSRVIGCLCVDNLLSHRALSESDCELVQLYATTVGHLCTRRRSEDSLKTALEVQRRLEERMLEAGREEQQRIGGLLHDSLGQELAGMAYLAKALQRAVESGQHDAAKLAEDISELASAAADHVRRIARGLVPVDLPAAGLEHALQALAADTAEVFKLTCSFEARGPLLVHDNAIGTNLYYIAREAVSNAVRHAGAGRIEIELWAEGTIRHLAVHDNGKGVCADASSRGLGMSLMNHRADLIGGSLHIRSRPGGGTTVECVFREVVPSVGQDAAPAGTPRRQAPSRKASSRRRVVKKPSYS